VDVFPPFGSDSRLYTSGLQASTGVHIDNISCRCRHYCDCWGVCNRNMTHPHGQGVFKVPRLDNTFSGPKIAAYGKFGPTKEEG
jgi:hypothetical protein